MASSMQNPDDRRKIALIIGNDDYGQRQNRLSNSINNARELSNKLKTINFNVTTACNLTKHQMTIEIIDFSKTIRDGDLVFFYFAGHGYQVTKKNYLMPVDDDRIESDRDVEDFATNAERIFSRLVRRNQSYVTILILDCCRPYVRKGASGASSMSESTGLHEMKASDGGLIQFACAANETASNDLFAKHLLKNITGENVDISDMFRRISDDVYRESDRKQRPFFTNGLHQHHQVYLNRNDLSTARFLTDTPLSAEEKDYFEDCKEYYRLTGQPLVSIADEVFDDSTAIPSASIKFGIEEDCNKFDLRAFLSAICDQLKLKLSDITMKRIQTGSVIMEADIFEKFESEKDKKFSLKMVVQRITDFCQKQFAKMKVFFMFLGPIKSLFEMQKYRAEINLNPQYNRVYTPGRDYWDGPNNDGKDRGGKPYYCPVGWQRWSFYITRNFDDKFDGWCISYHGTKFAHGLSILLSGMKPADVAVHGPGIYTTPSVNYACHPRYSEVKLIQPSSSSKFFKSGKYVQFVLECRVHPDNFKIVRETLGVSNTTIDPNIDNEIIEWLIDNQGKKLVDLNDPNSPIVCTGILIRVTDEHPGLLPGSQWWFQSHICNNPKCCLLSIDLPTLQKQRQNGGVCNIIFD